MKSFQELISGGLIVSCSGTDGRIAEAAAAGGASALLVSGADGVRRARERTSLPIIASVGPRGLDGPGSPPESARALLAAGADVLAVDGASARALVSCRGSPAAPVLVQVRSPEEAMEAVRGGADALWAKAPPSMLELLRRSGCGGVPLVAGGALRDAGDVERLFQAGAHAVVLEESLFDPAAIVRRFAVRPAARQAGIGGLQSEQRNRGTREIDSLTVIGILRLINAEDGKVASCVEAVLPEVAVAVEMVTACFLAGGRLLYVGAGTSGRLGIADAAECPPTFGVPAEMVQGLIAGGDAAIRRPVEGAEDDEALGRSDIAARLVSSRDVVVGIASSGRMPYVIGALREARGRGARTVAIANNPDSEIGGAAEHRIEILTGPEVILGSTRMKAGTAQKMVLNMISTASMIRTGRVYSNLMVDLAPSNSKLMDRSVRLIMEATGADRASAERSFEESGHAPKVAVLMILKGVDRAAAVDALAKAGGVIGKACGLPEP